MSPDATSSFFPSSAGSTVAPPGPLFAIAEAGPQVTGDESDEDEDEGEGVVWRSVDATEDEADSVIKAGYLWKKGVRRKVLIIVLPLRSRLKLDM